MAANITSTALTATTTLATTSIPDVPTDDIVPAHHASPVVAFIIGLAIITLASILNAAGLNLTKLDHVRFAAVYMQSSTLLSFSTGPD